MEFQDIAKKLNLTLPQVRESYETGMRKILHPKNRHNIITLMITLYGERDANKLIEAGTWRTKGNRELF